MEKGNKFENSKIVKVKKQTIVGKESYVNTTTGSIEEFTVINKNINQDFNFHKIWLQDVLNVLDSFGNKKILVITYLLKSMRNEDNTFSGTYREISKKCLVSLPTVSLVMNELIDSDVIRKLSTATYQFNPSLIIKGNSEKRKNLLIRYITDDDDKQIQNASNKKEYHQTDIFEQIEEIEKEKKNKKRIPNP